MILVQDFCPLQIKSTQCPGGFRLKVLGSQTAKRNNGYLEFLRNCNLKRMNFDLFFAW